MISTTDFFKVSIIALTLSTVLTACQADQAQQQAATSASAPKALNIKASHYHQVQVAGQEYQVFTDGQGLQIKLGETQQSSYSGSFNRLTLQPLSADSLLLAAMDSNDNSLYLWRFSPKEQKPLVLIRQQLISSRVVEDLCFYQSHENQQLSLFLLGGRGGADQLLLQQKQEWLAEPVVIRELNVPYDSKACVVDQQTAALYIAEADRAIWSYQAEPEADEGRSLVQVNQPFGQLQGEILGLQLLPDSSLLALEAEPARLLHLSSTGQVIHHSSIPAFAEATGLSVRVQGNSTTAYISNEDADAVQSLKLQETTAVATTKPAMAQVQPILQTEAASQRGDVMDDPAVWHHPTQPELSLILGTDKRAGLDVYSMQGKRVQQLAVGRLNNVDVRYNLNWQGKQHDIAVASLRNDNSLQLFAIDQKGLLHNAGKVPTSMKEIYGLCMYKDAKRGSHYVFVNDKSGLIEQYRINSDGTHWQGTLVRSLQVPSQPEGCVADDKRGILFVGEEDEAVWRFAAGAEASSTGEKIISVDGKRLVDDIEGIALAEHNGASYLVVSSQGNDSYIIYDAAPPYTERLRFRVTTNPQLGIDGASETDGLEVTTRSLGPGFEQGALIVQDGRNRMPEQGQNMKLVPWSSLLQELQKQDQSKQNQGK
ncbi:3-phytase (myo-inositol-hexaphosphate 3-phosphohydrolase) [Rheinheimera sp. A13L]|uniref:phytase n=1 Tax=Rheinheimera sp. A13L TaxID=506534 RepID=UPI0002124C66|nr:phytase [Rheinheimera sp. A13L]EGM76421.1 3-phytase (myo-inositol-hexaphosphate 3-phosphohydrolase) [Rheinheimera sp. A13L]